jgi:hypothetical protein
MFGASWPGPFALIGNQPMTENHVMFVGIVIVAVLACVRYIWSDF